MNHLTKNIKTSYQSKKDHLAFKARALRQQISSTYSLITNMKQKISENGFRYKAVFSDQVLSLESQKLAFEVLKQFNNLLSLENSKSSASGNDLLKSLYNQARQIAENLNEDYKKEKAEIEKIQIITKNTEEFWKSGNISQEELTKFMLEEEKIKRSCKQLYRKLVKYLHPDSMESMAYYKLVQKDKKARQKQKDLFVQLKEAYKENDLEQLEAIHESVMGQLDSIEDTPCEISEEDLQKSIAKSKRLLAALDSKVQILSSQSLTRIDFSPAGIARTKQKLSLQIQRFIKKQNTLIREINQRYGIEPKSIQIYMDDLLGEET